MKGKQDFERGRQGETNEGRGLSSGAKALFWQVALTNGSALKSSLGINPPNHVSG